MAKLIQVIESLARVDAGNGQGYDAVQYFLPDGRLIGQDPNRSQEPDLLNALAQARAKLGDQARRAGDAERLFAAQDRQAAELLSQVRLLEKQLADAVAALNGAGFQYNQGAEKPWRPPVNFAATTLYRLLDQIERWRGSTAVGSFTPLWTAVDEARKASR